MEEIVTTERLAEDLQRLGLQAGDTVLVHSSLSSIGQVEGGPATVIEALLQVLTPTGTLLMPSFNWSQPYDPDLPSAMGAVTEAFRRWPGVVRGFHPTHPLNALGPRAHELLGDHMQDDSPCGPQSPFGKLMGQGGKILLLGVDHDRNTTLHALEAEAEGAYLSERDVAYYDATRTVQRKHMRLFPGPHRDFLGLDPLLVRRGAQVTGKVGRALARLVDAPRMHDVVMAALRDNPAAVLCDNPECHDCVTQRRKLRLARLAQESFTLSALASSISPYPDEIAFELSRAGLQDVVLDGLFGLTMCEVPESQLQRALRTLAEADITVGAVYCSPDKDTFVSHLAGAKALGAAGVVVPFPPDPSGFFEAATAQGMEVFFENVRWPSEVCERVLADLPESAVVAFNPAEFARVGQKPFLHIVNHGAFRRWIGMLYLSDATFSGRYTLPGRGNGEVKELLSLLRARSFDGRVVIATGPGGPPFRDLVEGFWRLMETS